jgi:hypothetical protein
MSKDNRKLQIKLDWRDVPSGHKDRPSGVGPHKKEEDKRKADKIRREMQEQRENNEC